MNDLSKQVKNAATDTTTEPEDSGFMVIGGRHCQDIYDTFEVDERTGARKIPFDAPSDQDSPLTDAGKVQAKAMGDWIKSKGYEIDAVLMPECKRVQETFEHMGLDIPEENVTVLDSLYADKTGEDHLGNLQAFGAFNPAANEAKCVLVLGRRPAVPELMETFSQDSESNQPIPFTSKECPHGAMMAVSFGDDVKGTIDLWNDKGIATGNLVAVAKPDLDGNVIDLNQPGQQGDQPMPVGVS